MVLWLWWSRNCRRRRFGRNFSSTAKTRGVVYDVFISSPYAKWKFTTGDSVSSSPAITQSGDIVFGSNDENLYCLTSAGSQRWKFKTGDRVRSSPAITQSGDIVFGSSDHNLYCLTSATFGWGDSVECGQAPNGRGFVHRSTALWSQFPVCIERYLGG